MAKKNALKKLTEDLDYVANMLGGGMDQKDLPGMFFDAPLVGDPADQTDMPVDSMFASLLDDDDLDDDEGEDIAVALASPFCAAITSVIHKAFTNAMDNLVIAGELDQPQRIDLSRCIGRALDAFTQELGTCDWSDDVSLSQEAMARFMESRGKRLSEGMQHRLTDAQMQNDGEAFLRIAAGAAPRAAPTQQEGQSDPKYRRCVNAMGRVKADLTELGSAVGTLGDASLADHYKKIRVITEKTLDDFDDMLMDHFDSSGTYG